MPKKLSWTVVGETLRSAEDFDLETLDGELKKYTRAQNPPYNVFKLKEKDRFEQGFHTYTSKCNSCKPPCTKQLKLIESTPREYGIFEVGAHLLDETGQLHQNSCNKKIRGFTSKERQVLAANPDADVDGWLRAMDDAGVEDVSGARFSVTDRGPDTIPDTCRVDPLQGCNQAFITEVELLAADAKVDALTNRGIQIRLVDIQLVDVDVGPGIFIDGGCSVQVLAEDARVLPFDKKAEVLPKGQRAMNPYLAQKVVLGTIGKIEVLLHFSTHAEAPTDLEAVQASHDARSCRLCSCLIRNRGTRRRIVLRSKDK